MTIEKPAQKRNFVFDVYRNTSPKRDKKRLSACYLSRNNFSSQKVLPNEKIRIIANEHRTSMDK